jgi:hypothetical protein
MVIEPIADDPTLKELLERLNRPGGVVCVSGLWGSSAPMAAAAAARRRSLLYVTAHLDEADAVLEDLELFGALPCHLLPAWESGVGGAGDGPAGAEIQAERLRLCHRLHVAPAEPLLMVAPIQALMQPVPAPETLEAWTLRLGTNQRRDLSGLVSWLADSSASRRPVTLRSGATLSTSSSPASRTRSGSSSSTTASNPSAASTSPLSDPRRSFPPPRYPHPPIAKLPKAAAQTKALLSSAICRLMPSSSWTSRAKSRRWAGRCTIACPMREKSSRSPRC